MATIVYSVEFRVDTNGKLYRHFMKKAGYDGVRCNGMIERALNECLMELIENRFMGGERKGDDA